MNKRKRLLVMTVIFILLVIIISILFHKNPERSTIEIFLKRYYTVDSEMLSDTIDQQLINDAMSKYSDILEKHCLELFISSRKIMMVKEFADNNIGTVKVKNIDLTDKGKTINGFSDYTYLVKLEITVNGDKNRMIEHFGVIQMKKIGGKPRITYIDNPVLK